MAAANDTSDRALEVGPEEVKLNSAADQMDAALATYAAIAESATASDTAGYALTTHAAVIKAAMATDVSAGTRTAVAQVVVAASGQDQASARFDGVAAQVDAASAAVTESVTVSYIGVVNLAGESLNAVVVQDATSINLRAVTETARAAVAVDSMRYVSGDVTEASAAVELAAIRHYIGWGRDSVSHDVCNGDNFRRRDRKRTCPRPWRKSKRQPGRRTPA